MNFILSRKRIKCLLKSVIRRESIGRNVRVVAKMQKGWSVTGATAAGASCAKRTVATPMRTRTTKMGSPVGSVTYKAL